MTCAATSRSIEGLYDPQTETIDLDGKICPRTGIRYIGKARRRLDDHGNAIWVCLADAGALVLVEINASPVIITDHDPGDEDRPRRRVSGAV